MTCRVAMVGACPYPVPQGSQVYLRDTAQGLSDRGHEVHLVVYGHGIGEDTSGLSIHRAPSLPGVRRTAAGPSLAKPVLDLALVVTLRRVVRAHAIDIVHAHNYEALVVALAAGRRSIVYHAHNAMADELPHYFGHRPAAARLGAWLDRTFPRRADRVIVPHQALAAYLAERGCEASRITVIPPPVDADRFTPGPPSDDAPPVLYAGNLDAYQNLGLLERAVARVRADRPDTRFVVATADERPFPGAERVATPDLDALRRVLAQDAVFACPRVSWSGYPIKLLNAMAAGLAIVACRSAAHPLSHDHDGLVVPDNDEAAFAQALSCLLEDPARRRRLGDAARQTVLTTHRPDAIAAQIEQVYRQLF